MSDIDEEGFADIEAPDDGELLDPFSPENCPKLNLVVNMRIYDALMAILNEQDSDAADRLNEVHQRGGIVGALPFLNLGE